MKKELIIIVSVTLIVVGLSGCVGNSIEESKFIGSWCYGTNCNNSITYNSDKTYTGVYRGNNSSELWEYYSGEWKIQDGKLATIRTSDYSNLRKTYEYYFIDSIHVTLIDATGKFKYNLTKYKLAD